MPPVTVSLAFVIFAAGAVAGGLGVALGLGGGIFLVPFLTLALGFSFKSAAAVSLTTVIATSSAVASARAGKHVMNLRLGMLLEVATAAGSLLGGITAQIATERVLQRSFGVVAIAVAGVMFARLNRRNVILCSIDAPAPDVGRLGGRFFEAESDCDVAYRVKRLPLAVGASFVAGNLSSLLGIGGGIIKVPVLNAWCGVPMRAAAATSALMIGVTATGGAIIYFGHGDLRPVIAAPAVLGVQLGSWVGMLVAQHAPVKWLKVLMAVLLIIVAGLMFARSGL